MNLLLTSIGKRVELIEHLKTRFRVVGVDASPENAARHFTDAFYLIPKCREDGYVEALLTVCKKERISLLVPLYEPEFAILEAAGELFAQAGVKLVLSDKRVLDICGDKRKTAAFFEKYGLPAPKTLTAAEAAQVISGEKGRYPYIVKPIDGMGSEGVFTAKDLRELAFFSAYKENMLVQEKASGREYTIDVLCDFSGEPVYMVPRIRLEVLSGEVSKSRVDLHKAVLEETERLLKALNTEGRVCGPLTLQCFVEEKEDSPVFIEINPRFGGGVPLAFAAGADYAAALERMGECFAACHKAGEAEGERRPDLACFREKEIRELTMFRYSQAVYEEKERGTCPEVE